MFCKTNPPERPVMLTVVSDCHGRGQLCDVLLRIDMPLLMCFVSAGVRQTILSSVAVSS